MDKGVRANSLVGGPGTNRGHLQFTDVVFILVKGKVKPGLDPE